MRYENFLSKAKAESLEENVEQEEDSEDQLIKDKEKQQERKVEINNFLRRLLARASEKGN